MKKFDIYANVRRLRQAAGDKAEELLAADNKANATQWQEWRQVENLLSEAECKLERLNLKED